ncbi:hypothetical protein [Clostridium chrysemydis]|uniref:hypothetical protein n=1 Tax=Clostridium chrysemydis TaxID=2665504 RepID=UPI0018836665|nr:hypothetical protein [Clostridium chrysemydis]
MNSSTLYNDLLEIYRVNNLHNNRDTDKLLQMLNNKGAVLTAKELIRNNDMDFDIEEIVLKDRYSEIFSEEDRDICKRRLTHKNDNISELT